MTGAEGDDSIDAHESTIARLLTGDDGADPLDGGAGSDVYLLADTLGVIVGDESLRADSYGFDAYGNEVWTDADLVVAGFDDTLAAFSEVSP